MDENSSAESNNRKAFEDELESSLNSILASDDSRRGAFQLSYEEEQQNIVVCEFVQSSVLLTIHFYFLLVKCLWFLLIWFRTRCQYCNEKNVAFTGKMDTHVSCID